MNSGEYISKLDLIWAVLDNRKMTTIQKLVAIGIIRHVNKEFSNAFMGAGTLARYAGLGKTDRVWLALKALEKEHGFIARANRSNGQSNTYRILPQRVIDAVAAEYEARKRTRNASPRPTPDYDAGPQPTPDLGVGLNQKPTAKNGVGPEFKATPEMGVGSQNPPPSFAKPTPDLGVQVEESCKEEVVVTRARAMDEPKPLDGEVLGAFPSKEHVRQFAELRAKWGRRDLLTSDVDHKLAEMSLRSWLSPHLTIPQNLLEHALVSTLQRMQEKLDKGEDGKSFQGYFSRALLGSITKAVNLARDAEAEPSTRFSQKNGKVNHNAVLDRLFEGLSSS